MNNTNLLAPLIFFVLVTEYFFILAYIYFLIFTIVTSVHYYIIRLTNVQSFVVEFLNILPSNFSISYRQISQYFSIFYRQIDISLVDKENRKYLCMYRCQVDLFI